METRIIDGEEVTAEFLIKKHKGFIWQQVYKFKPRTQGSGMDDDDLFNSASIGVVKSFHKYDPDRGCKFLTLAGQEMWAAMDSEYRKTNGMIRVPAHTDVILRKIGKDDLWKEEPEVIAEKIGEKVSRVKSALEWNRKTVSYDEPVKEDGDALELLLGNNQDQSSIIVKDFFEYLTPNEIEVLELQLRNVKHRDIGTLLNRSHGYANHILKKVAVKLQNYLEGIEMQKVEKKSPGPVAQGNMKEPKRLLVETDMSISDIAKQTGVLRGSLSYHAKRLRKTKKTESKKTVDKKNTENKPAPKNNVPATNSPATVASFSVVIPASKLKKVIDVHKEKENTRNDLFRELEQDVKELTFVNEDLQNENRELEAYYENVNRDHTSMKNRFLAQQEEWAETRQALEQELMALKTQNKRLEKENDRLQNSSKNSEYKEKWLVEHELHIQLQHYVSMLHKSHISKVSAG